MLSPLGNGRGLRPRHRLWSLRVLALLMLAPGHALSQNTTEATIAALQARIEALERRLAAFEDATRGAQRPLPSLTAADTGANSHVAAQPATAADDMARALERALVREGGLLLPPAVVEVEPRWSYLHRSSAGLELLSAGGQPQLVQMGRRWDAQLAALGVRVGLPAQTQLEFLLPYASLRQRAAGAGTLSSDDTASGMGAAEVGLNWQLQPASSGLGIVAALRWTEPGSSDLWREFALPVSSSFRSLQAGLLLVKRRDPVVFFGALSHATRWPQRIAGHTIDPGYASGLRAGAIIALSPDTSLRLGLDLGWSGDSRVDGIVAKGSSALSGELSTGFSLVLSPKIVLGVETGIGLTRTSPDFRIGLSLPVRF
jgi:hypothetical protein